MDVTLELKNFRCFRDLRWEPDGVCAVVGANGSGKSTLFSCVDLLRTTYRESFGKALSFNGGPFGLRNLHTPSDETVEIRFCCDGVCWALTPSVENGQSDSEFGELVTDINGNVLVERPLYSKKFLFEGKELLARENSALKLSYEMSSDNTVVQPITEMLNNFRMYSDYRLFVLRQSGSRSEGDHYLKRGGENLFSVLRNWRDRSASRESYEWVRTGMKAAFPNYFSGWEFEIFSQNVSMQFRLETTADELIPASLMPDGVLVALLHLTAVAGAVPGTLICLDEMENALHPFAIKSLLSTIRQIARERDLTVALSTHSPVLLDEFKLQPENVFVLGHRLEGESNEIATLAQLRDPEWLMHFSTGTLYSDLEFGSRISQ